MRDLDFSNITAVREHVARLEVQTQMQMLSKALNDVLQQIAKRGARKELVAEAETLRENLNQMIEDHFSPQPEPGTLPPPPTPPSDTS